MKLILTLFTTFLFFIIPNKEATKLLKSPAQLVIAAPPPPLDCATPTSNVEKIVCLATAFKATLTAAQIASLEIAFTTTTQARWSNLPGGVSIRNGLEYSTLTAAQLTAAKAVIQAASGTTAQEGYAEFSQIAGADTYLGTIGGGSGYSEGKYIIAFLGTPSLTGKWMLQFGGHHYAQNITFNAGKVIGTTPSHQGIEPLSFTTTAGTFTPMLTEQAAMLAMLSSLTTAQLTSAKLSASFGDVALGPNKDSQFPATKLGLKCSTLTAAQKALVMAAMKPWTQDVDDASGTAIQALYERELDETYIGYSGNPTLAANADYVRIDGPSVWIELVCQSGVVVRGQIHYHAIYRDHTRDYGESGTFVGTKEVAATNAVFQLGANYPNPFNNSTTIPFTLKGAGKVSLKVFDLLGREIAVIVNENREEGKQTITINNGNGVKLNQGSYMYQLTVENNAGKFSQTKMLIVQ